MTIKPQFHILQVKTADCLREDQQYGRRLTWYLFARAILTSWWLAEGLPAYVRLFRRPCVGHRSGSLNRMAFLAEPWSPESWEDSVGFLSGDYPIGNRI